MSHTGTLKTGEPVISSCHIDMPKHWVQSW